MSSLEEFRSEPDSFRDRTSRVFYQADTVLRALTAPALADWHQLTATTFFHRLHKAGKIVQTEQVETLCFCDNPPEFAASAHSSPTDPSPWVATLKHQKIPFISYPYEWSFGMLKDAALLQLELLQAALVLEFITREDPMVQTLLRHKDDHYADYDLAYFEQCVAAAFDIQERQPLTSGTRILYYGQPKI